VFSLSSGVKDKNNWALWTQRERNREKQREREREREREKRRIIIVVHTR